jgi:hypothetical protein
VVHPKPKLLADPAHAEVFGKHATYDVVHDFIAHNLKQPLKQGRTQFLRLEPIADQQCNLSSFGAVNLRQPLYPRNLMLAFFDVTQFSYEGHLSVVVDEADPDKPLMCHPCAQGHHVKVAQGDTPV